MARRRQKNGGSARNVSIKKIPERPPAATGVTAPLWTEFTVRGGANVWNKFLLDTFSTEAGLSTTVQLAKLHEVQVWTSTPTPSTQLTQLQVALYDPVSGNSAQTITGDAMAANTRASVGFVVPSWWNLFDVSKSTSKHLFTWMVKGANDGNLTVRVRWTPV